jgi:hypothetical protein
VTPIVPEGTTLQDPEGLVVTLDGRTFLADSGTRAVYEVDLQDGSLTERIPDVDAPALARDPQGRLLVLEGYAEIARYDPSSFTRELVVGTAGTFSGADQFSVVPEAGPLLRALVVLATLSTPRRVGLAARGQRYQPMSCNARSVRSCGGTTLWVASAGTTGSMS